MDRYFSLSEKNKETNNYLVVVVLFITVNLKFTVHLMICFFESVNIFLASIALPSKSFSRICPVLSTKVSSCVVCQCLFLSLFRVTVESAAGYCENSKCSSRSHQYSFHVSVLHHKGRMSLSLFSLHSFDRYSSFIIVLSFEFLPFISLLYSDDFPVFVHFVQLECFIQFSLLQESKIAGLLGQCP